MSLEGRFEEKDIPGIWQILAKNNRYGPLHFVHKDGGGHLVFKRGQVVSGNTDATRKIGRRLIDRGLVTESQLLDARQKQGWKEKKPPLGAILIEQGFIKKDDLDRVVRDQLIDVAAEILSWKAGAFFFEPGDPQVRSMGMEFGMDVETLVKEASRVMVFTGASPAAGPSSPAMAKSAPTNQTAATSPIPPDSPPSAGASQPALVDVEALVGKLSPSEKVILTQRLLEEGWGPVPGADTPEDIQADRSTFLEAVELEIVPELLEPGLADPPQRAGPAPSTSPPPASSQETGEKAFENARRLARVIVSDIAMYNPKVVEGAVKAGDIEQVLGGHLSAARKLLARRVSPEVLATHDFLGEALQDLINLIQARIKTNPSS